MTDQDEFDRLRDRIETLEDELGVESDSETRAAELVDDTCSTWLKCATGSRTYYYPADSVRFECDDWNDADLQHHFVYCVKVRVGGTTTVEVLEDSRMTLDDDIVPMSRSAAEAEIREAMQDD